MTEPRQRVLISGWFGNGNLGDEAVLAGMLKVAAGGNQLVQFHALSDSAEETASKFGIKATQRRLGWRRLVSEARAVMAADVLVVGGGGLIKDYGPAPGNVHRWLAPVLMAKVLRRRVMLYAMGVDEIRFEQSRRFAVLALKHVDVITARDRSSAEQLQALAPSHRLTITADPAILLGDPPPVRSRQAAVVVNLRHWYTRGRQVEDPAAVERLYAELAAALDSHLERHGGEVWFVPFRATKGDDDILPCREVRDRMLRGRSTKLLPVPSSPSAAVSLFASTELVIATRLHAAILAAAARTPFAAFPYAPKVRNFLDELDMGARSLDLEEAQVPGRLGTWLDGIYESREQTASHLAVEVPKLIRRAQLNGSLLGALVAGDRTAIERIQQRLDYAV